MAAGQSLRDRDLAKWLENKLADDLWNSHAAAALLTGEVLGALDGCFLDLLPHVKTKLLLAILHLPPKSLEQWREPIDALVRLSLRDTDDWVQTVAELLRDLAASGRICSLGADADSSHFARSLADLRKLFGEQADLSLTPVDALFCGSAGGPAHKHFALKRRPRSAALRKELLSKAADLTNQPKVKSGASLSAIVPIRARNMVRSNMDDSSPMRGIPTQKATQISGGFTHDSKRTVRPSLKRDGGSKLIEIAETPQALRKKRKIWEAEQKEARQRERGDERKRQLDEKEDRKRAMAQARSDAANAKRSAAEAKAASIRQQLSQPRLPAGGGDSHLNSVIDGVAATAADDSTPDYAAALVAPRSVFGIGTAEPPPPPPPAGAFLGGRAAPAPPGALRPTAARMPASRVVPRTRPGVLPYGAPMPPSTGADPRSRMYGAAPSTSQQTPPPTYAPPSVAPPLSPSADDDDAANRPVYTISRDVMQQAQEMFRSANKLSRPEKALILGFMAGNRENPCPQLGQLLTVRLSESQELEVSADANEPARPVFVETFFQMNYATGEWKRLRKVKPLQPTNLT